MLGRRSGWSPSPARKRRPGIADLGTGSERLEHRAALCLATGLPAFSGVMEYLTLCPYDALLRLDKPGPGAWLPLCAVNFGGQSMVALNIYMYGDQAAATVARENAVVECVVSETLSVMTTKKPFSERQRAMSGRLDAS